MRLAPALAAALSIALAGCGWRAGLPTPEGATSLAVAFPGNDSHLRDLELDFGLALADVALERLALEPAAPADADLVLRGRVLDLRGRGGIRSAENELLEAGVNLRVELELLDRRSGAVLGRAERALEAGFLVPEFSIDPATDGLVLGPESPFRADEANPTRLRLVRNLAEGLILDLFAPPSYETDTPAIDPGAFPDGDGPSLVPEG